MKCESCGSNSFSTYLGICKCDYCGNERENKSFKKEVKNKSQIIIGDNNIQAGGSITVGKERNK